MKNAKEEFEKEVKENGKPICAKVGIDKEDYGSSIKWYILNPNYTDEEYKDFLKQIDFYYDNGYGSQELFGKILFTNSFSNRYEYDGSEYWKNHKMPSINETINTKNKY